MPFMENFVGWTRKSRIQTADCGRRFKIFTVKAFVFIE